MAGKKIVLIVMDGMPDAGKHTPMEEAKKPNMDGLARMGKAGLLDLEYRDSVDSDLGYLKLLSCFSEKGYPGRGYLEALGAGLNPVKSDVCIRANFATLDNEGNVADRRAGRDEKGLDGLAESIDGWEIDGINFIVKKTSGHRLVIVMSGSGLSTEVVPNDPYRTGVSVPQIIQKNADGKFTASVLNKFLYRANKLLAAHPINRKRRMPANAILVRNFGRMKAARQFKDVYGMEGCCIAGIAIAKGVSRFLGLDVIDVKGATGLPDTDLGAKFAAALAALNRYGFVFLHINGTDILGHDGKRGEKAAFIEKVDGFLGKFVGNIDIKNTIICITSDHMTSSLGDTKHYQHLPGPVPLIVAGGGIRPDVVRGFDELSVCKGSLRLKSNQLIPELLKLGGWEQ